MAARSIRTPGPSRSHSEARPEPTIVPPTPVLSNSEVEPSLRDIYDLVAHVKLKVTALDKRITTIENMQIEHDGSLSEIKDQTKHNEALLNGLQEMVSRVKENLQPSTPEGQVGTTDSAPTPRLARPTVRIEPPRRSRSREVKPLASPLRSPSPAPGAYTGKWSFTANPTPTPSNRAPTTTPQTAVPKIKEPDAFDGTRGTAAADWALRVVMWAKHVQSSFPDEQSMVLHILGMTKGKGANWARPHIMRIIKNQAGAITTMQELTSEFSRHFEEPDAKRSAGRKINKLTQTADVEAYITKFENLEAELDWNEEALQAAFKKGLHWKVKELLSQIYPAPPTFHDVKQHARRIDATRRENEASRPKREPAAKKATPVATTTKSTTTTSTTRVPLSDSANYVSPEEREKRHAENLCIKCGSPDHKFRECKNGWKKERVPGKGKKKEETAKIAEVPESEPESASEN